VECMYSSPTLGLFSSWMWAMNFTPGRVTPSDTAPIIHLRVCRVGGIAEDGTILTRTGIEPRPSIP
jgi:hypothetical protein